MVLFLLLNVSVPDQSDNICNKVLRSPTARGERGRKKEITGRGNGRATGDDEQIKEYQQWDGCQGKRLWICLFVCFLNLSSVYQHINYSLMILNYSFLLV